MPGLLTGRLASPSSLQESELGCCGPGGGAGVAGLSQPGSQVALGCWEEAKASLGKRHQPGEANKSRTNVKNVET